MPHIHAANHAIPFTAPSIWGPTSAQHLPFIISNHPVSSLGPGCGFRLFLVEALCNAEAPGLQVECRRTPHFLRQNEVERKSSEE